MSAIGIVAALDPPDAAGILEAAAVPAQLDPAAEVANARELRARNHPGEAEATFRGVLANDPGYLAALIELGHIRRTMGDFSGAVTAFQAAATASPRHIGLRVEIGRHLRLADQLDEAEASLAALIADEPACVGAFVELGHCARRRGDHTVALTAFERAAAIDPANTGVALERAAELRALGRNGEAEAILRELLAVVPEAAAPATSLGHLLVETNRLAEAKALFTELRRADPTNGRITVTLAKVAKRLGDPIEAAQHLSEALATDAANLEIRVGLAAELREQGRLDEAVAVIGTAPPESAGAPALLIERSRILRATDDRRGAAGSLDRAAAKAEIAVDLLVDVAREKRALADQAGAEAALRLALERQPGHLGALLALAEFALQAGDPGDALGFAEHAIVAHPGQLGPYLLGARAAAAISNRERSAELLDEARSRFGERPAIAAMQIHILRGMQDFTSALQVVAGIDEASASPDLWAERTALAIAVGDFAAAERALAQPPTISEEPRFHFFHGALAEARRDYQGAAANYAEAIRLRPSEADWHAEMARARLLMLDVEAAAALLVKSTVRSSLPGRPARPSQHFLGQILDEFALDPTVLARLHEARSLPSDGEIGALREIVRSSPESTAAAVMLLLALRRAGGLRAEPAVAAGTAAKIPRRVVQFWDRQPIPSDIAGLIGSWDDPFGEYEHVVFDDRSAEAFLRETCDTDIASAYRRSKHVAQRADIFRLAWLAVEGGIYVDADDRRAAPLASLAPDGATFVGYQESYGTIGNNFLATVAAHPVIVRALELAALAINRGDHDSIWLATGPGLMTRAFAEMVTRPDGGDWPGRAVVREQYEMPLLVAMHCGARYKRAGGHWTRAGNDRFGP